MKRLFAILGGIAAVLLLAFLLLRTPDIDAGLLRAKYANADSAFVTVEPGLTVHVRDQGPADAPALLLIHGSSASLHTWEPWVERLTSRYRVISYDQPGHGLTGPHPRGCYSADCMVAVADAVARARNLDRFVIGGNSMGGWVAWNYALAHPDRLAGMILVDASGIDVPRDQKGVPIGFRIMQTPIVNRIGTQITPRSLIEASLRKTVTDQSRVTDAEIDRYWELLRYPGNRQAMIDRANTARGEGATAKRLSEINIPTLVLWGAEDSLIPLEAGKLFAERLPDAALVTYDGIGHIPQEEVADRSAADVASFLKTVYPPAPGFSAP